jgi:uncharacterized membrane protein
MNAPNDWDIKRCLAVCLIWYLLVLVLAELTSLGLDVPVIRQLVTLLFLVLVPGILILRILKIHNVSIIESLLYSVGLSIAFIMVVGVILNFALPAINVGHPISTFPLLTALTIAILILGITAYIRDKSFVLQRPPSHQILKETKTKVRIGSRLNVFLLAVLLPLISILGTSLVNSYQNNAVLLLLIFIVVIIIGLVAFNRFIPAQVYPFMIVAIAIALLYQTTLISNYLVGSDIHEEYYFAQLVSQSGYWDASIASSINSCLSIVILAPVYSLFLNTDIVWLFKIVYPIFFCLVPLALYRIFRLQIGPRYAFIATVFFITMPMFFMDMAQLVRQQVAELFFVLVILLMVDRRLTMLQRTILVIIFGFGVIVSHYGLGTGYAIGYITLGMLLLIIIKSRPGRRAWQWIIGRNGSLPDDLADEGAFTGKAIAIIVGLSLVFMFVYYGAVASGTGLSGVRVATGIAERAIQTAPSTKEPLILTAIGFDFPAASLGGKIWRILQYLVELCLIVGFLRLIFRPATLGKLKAEYISLNIVSVIILLGIFILPAFSDKGNIYAYGMGSTRIWHISLLITAPLFLFGGETIVYGVMRLMRMFRKGTDIRSITDNKPVLLRYVVLVVLIPYFIFNSGAIFELCRSQTTNFIDIPYSIALSGYRQDLNTVFTTQDLRAAYWLSNVAKDDEPVYVDHHSGKLLSNQVGHPISTKELTANTQNIDIPGYLYLRSWNTENKVLTFGSGYALRQSIRFEDLPWLNKTMETADRIYYNGGAEVLVLD